VPNSKCRICPYLHHPPTAPTSSQISSPWPPQNEYRILKLNLLHSHIPLMIIIPQISYLKGQGEQNPQAIGNSWLSRATTTRSKFQLTATLSALFVSRHLLPRINLYTVVSLLNYNSTGNSPSSSPRSTFQYLQLQPLQPSTYCTQRHFTHGLDPRGYYLVLQPLQYGQNSLISGSNDQLVGAVVTFVACSTICAQSMGALITGRSTQGLAAG
jgi:hypothetical protein